MYHCTASGASGAARRSAIAFAFSSSLPKTNSTRGSGERSLSQSHAKAKSVFASGRASARRTSQLGHFPWSHGFFWLPRARCFADVTPQAMEMWFGPLIVGASRIVFAVSDHAQPYSGRHAPSRSMRRLAAPATFSTASARRPSSMITSAFGLRGGGSAAMLNAEC